MENKHGWGSSIFHGLKQTRKTENILVQYYFINVTITQKLVVYILNFSEMKIYFLSKHLRMFLKYMKSKFKIVQNITGIESE